MLIDTHCHLADRHLPASEIDGVIERALAAGVKCIISTDADPEDTAQIMQQIEKYECVYGTIGRHPHHADTELNIDWEALLKHPKIVAVGEIGLDYHYVSDNKAEQIEMFRQQMEIARKHKMPVAIHSRDAFDDTLSVLREFPDVRGVMHCVYTNWDFVRAALDLGYFISTSGTLTFANKDEAREIFRRAPIDRIVIETDAPYLAPVPYRGKTCEPAMITETARTLSEIRDIPMPELSQILMENTKKLFPRLKI
ncbi:MAG: TatD family hydrolase [Alphaproteobacteria bacterium]|nr:TatD family hydrolase [Alphaproteobacteria bacterium]